MAHPPTTGALPPDPQITIYVVGLGLLCFNQRANRAEIGFLNLPNHNLYISMWDSHCKPLIGPEYEITDRLNSIPSSVTGSVEILKSGDPMDFSYIYELSELYTDEITLKSKPFHTRLHISNAVFYSHPAHAMLRPFEANNPSEVEKDRETAQILQIATKGVINDLTIDGTTYKLTAGERYEMVLTVGPCRASNLDSDFKFLYDHLDYNGGKPRYNIRHVSGPYPLLSTCQRQAATALSEQLFSFLNDEQISEDDNNRQEISNNLQLLQSPFNCPPAGCLVATIGEKSVVLP